MTLIPDWLRKHGPEKEQNPTLSGAVSEGPFEVRENYKQVQSPLQREAALKIMEMQQGLVGANVKTPTESDASKLADKLTAGEIKELMPMAHRAVREEILTQCSQSSNLQKQILAVIHVDTPNTAIILMQDTEYLAVRRLVEARVADMEETNGAD